MENQFITAANALLICTLTFLCSIPWYQDWLEQKSNAFWGITYDTTSRRLNAIHLEGKAFFAEVMRDLEEEKERIRNNAEIDDTYRWIEQEEIYADSEDQQ